MLNVNYYSYHTHIFSNVIGQLGQSEVQWRTVEPPNNGQIGSEPFVLYIEVVLFQKLRQTRPITQRLSISELVYNVVLVMMSFSCQIMYITMIAQISEF